MSKNPVVPLYSDLLLLVPSQDKDGGLLIETVPHWVADWVGKSPKEIRGVAVDDIFDGVTQALGEVAQDVYDEGRPVRNFCIEFSDVHGREWAVLLDAQRIENFTSVESPLKHVDESGLAVLIKLQDVTATVKTRRKALETGAFHGIIGRSSAMLKVFHKIEVYGPTDATVLISGETGTGKELVAAALHERSSRRSNPFVAVNCTALNEDLFESELFGHEKGSFTGAFKQHKGRFERAHKGTLFLDEIGDMPIRSQAKLLRVVEQGKIERIGSESEKSVDVRILAATNISLEQAVLSNHFRSDLYHRLAVLKIHVPPLRERKGDILLLVEHFLEVFNNRYTRKVKKISADALKILEEYHWPGNIRELRNVLERVFVESTGQVISGNAFKEWEKEREFFAAGAWSLEQIEKRKTPIYLPPPSRLSETVTPPMGNRSPVYPLPLDAEYQLKSSKEFLELNKENIQSAFNQTNGNLTKAAELLGVHKTTLYRNMKILGLSRKTLEEETGL